MSGTKKLRPADRHITRAECQALIVHTLNQVFGGALAGKDAYVPDAGLGPVTPSCGCDLPRVCAECMPLGGYEAVEV